LSFAQFEREVTGERIRDKCWPLDYFLTLTSELNNRKWTTAVPIGPVEQDRFEPTALARLRSAAPTIENCPLDKIAGLIAAANLYIGNDSGVSHLAAALGTPTVATFGPTDPSLWCPLGERVAVMSLPTGNWPDPAAVLSAAQSILIPPQTP
jgi:ADP-heptose:LPS heptosyltransferase